MERFSLVDLSGDAQKLKQGLTHTRQTCFMFSFLLCYSKKISKLMIFFKMLMNSNGFVLVLGGDK